MITASFICPGAAIAEMAVIGALLFEGRQAGLRLGMGVIHDALPPPLASDRWPAAPGRGPGDGFFCGWG